MKRNLLMLFVALSVLLASCARKDVVKPDTGEEKSVYVKISQAEGYAESAPVADGYKVTLSSGYLVFYDHDGIIGNVVKLVSGTPATGEVSLSALASGATIQNIRSSAYKVYVVCNPPDGYTAPSRGGSAGLVSEQRISLESQAILSNATVDGFGEITNNNGQNSVIVQLTPLVSRIEIAGMTALAPIESFKLRGIYFDNFYTHYQSYYGYDDDIIKLTESNFWDYDHETVYSSAPSMYDFDWDGLGQFNNNVVAPANGNVWGYSIFSKTIKPRIVLFFNELEISGDPHTSDKYLTIDGLQTTEGTPINTLEKGVVYRIAASDLQFSESDLSSSPVLTPKAVKVQIINTAWTIQGAKPTYGVKK